MKFRDQPLLVKRAVASASIMGVIALTILVLVILLLPQPKPRECSWLPEKALGLNIDVLWCPDE